MESPPTDAIPVGPSTPAVVKPGWTTTRTARLLLRGLRWLLSLVLLATAVELVCRYWVTPSVGATRFIFLQQMSLERWDYLLSEEHEDLLETIEVERVPSRQRNEQWMEEPEEDRPPYDRIRTTYSVTTNSDGFRDPPFTGKLLGSKRIVVLGDSISYGKGVPVEERYPDFIARAGKPRNVEVLNLAYPACGTTCEVALFEEYAHLQPDLVVYQPSGNDADTAMGQRAAQSGSGLPSAWALWLMRSRAVQLLTYGLFGDSKASQMSAAVEAAAEKYGPELERFFAASALRGVKVVVLTFPGSSGDLYGQHVIDACSRHPDVCLGSVVADLAHAGEIVPALQAKGLATPDWIRETADLLGLPEAGLAGLFPLAGLFLDIVHPNADAHRVAARQLESFLAAHWTGWK